MGYGDDQSEFGVYGDFDKWVDGLWTKLLSLHPFDMKKYAIDDSPLLGAPVTITVLPQESGSNGKVKESQSHVPTSASKLSHCKFYHPAPTFSKSATGKPIVATLAGNKRITADDWVRAFRAFFSLSVQCMMKSSCGVTLSRNNLPLLVSGRAASAVHV